ncbi:hypothetical protein [Duncaniella freteri]|uniref:hypothetical protein n=1 Tax=Duncaniella freteri TaxID=2530391 RepID=UPI003F668AFD
MGTSCLGHPDLRDVFRTANGTTTVEMAWEKVAGKCATNGGRTFATNKAAPEKQRGYKVLHDITSNYAA